MTEAVLIYPHQLFKENILLKNNRIIFLIEEPLFFTQYKFHKQKIILHRASMQYYKVFLEEKGFDVRYIESSALKKTEYIVNFLTGIEKVYFFDVVDNWLNTKLTTALSKNTVAFEKLDSPLFLTNKTELDSYFLPLIKEKKKLLMHSFYTWQRKRLSILTDSYNKPVGGKWSFDTDNRKKLPKGIALPERAPQNSNGFVLEAKKYVEKNFANHYGSVDTFAYPVTHQEAHMWFDDFLKNKLDSFGPYEDAVTKNDPFLFHSVLSPMLNNGLLDPVYVIKKTLEYGEKNKTSLASLEGFIRQIIGWREYIRAIYIYMGTDIRTSNYFNAQKEIPHSFWEGTTGIEPVDDSIKTALTYAYTHHIPRLMIMGNLMNLCGFKPDQVYKWFMELYIDAYDWVMVPNVYSMALYADGGLITTKPYISGSSYILKMSDYKKDAWSKIWDALFWYFVETHFKKLETEGRLGFIGITYQKMPGDKKTEYRKIAKEFLNSL